MSERPVVMVKVPPESAELYTKALRMRAEPCPLADSHEDGPEDYVGWHEWAKHKAKTHRQERCPGCTLWKRWVPKAAEPEAFTRGDFEVALRKVVGQPRFDPRVLDAFITPTLEKLGPMEPEQHVCPECGKPLRTQLGWKVHRSRIHDVTAIVRQGERKSVGQVDHGIGHRPRRGSVGFGRYDRGDLEISRAKAKVAAGEELTREERHLLQREYRRQEREGR